MEDSRDILDELTDVHAQANHLRSLLQTNSTQKSEPQTSLFSVQVFAGELPNIPTLTPDSKNAKKTAVSHRNQTRAVSVAKIFNNLLDSLGFDPASLDTLSSRTGLPTAQLQAQLLELELLGDVERLPGGWFQRVIQA